MKKIVLLLVIGVQIVSCSSEIKVNYPYKFVSTKSDTIGKNVNTMELYVIPKNMNLDTLKMFCLSQKNAFSSGTFHYIVFFDSKENAVFPNNPITAFYGTEEQPQKHIKAYYEYNRKNGYSKLFVYDTNSWESKAFEIDL